MKFDFFKAWEESVPDNFVLNGLTIHSSFKSKPYISCQYLFILDVTYSWYLKYICWTKEWMDE